MTCSPHPSTPTKCAGPSSRHGATGLAIVYWATPAHEQAQQVRGLRSPLELPLDLATTTASTVCTESTGGSTLPGRASSGLSGWRGEASDLSNIRVCKNARAESATVDTRVFLLDSFPLRFISWHARCWLDRQRSGICLGRCRLVRNRGMSGSLRQTSGSGNSRLCPPPQ